MVIEASPHADVVLAAFARGKSAAFDQAGMICRVPEAYFVELENRSDRDIFGLQAIWTSEDESGKVQKVSMRSDRFDCVWPAARAGKRVLLTPEMFFPESAGARPGDGGMMGSMNAVPVRQFARMAVDCVVFADGALYGPDELGYGEEIPARFAARTAVLTAARRAIDNGRPMAEALAVFLSIAARTSDFESKWARSYALMLKMMPGGGGRTLKFLEQIPEPPRIRRG